MAGTKTMNSRRPGRPASRGAPDVPQGQIDAGVGRYVKDVNNAWKWAVLENAEGRDLAVLMPHDQDPNQPSRKKFVDLLTFAEDSMGCNRVLAVFDKGGLTIAKGFPRTLHYVGFTALHPSKYPANIDPSTHFIMCYVV